MSSTRYNGNPVGIENLLMIWDIKANEYNWHLLVHNKIR